MTSSGNVICYDITDERTSSGNVTCYDITDELTSSGNVIRKWAGRTEAKRVLGSD